MHQQKGAGIRTICPISRSDYTQFRKAVQKPAIVREENHISVKALSEQSQIHRKLNCCGCCQAAVEQIFISGPSFQDEEDVYTPVSADVAVYQGRDAPFESKEQRE